MLSLLVRFLFIKFYFILFVLLLSMKQKNKLSNDNFLENDDLAKSERVGKMRKGLGKVREKLGNFTLKKEWPP